MNTFKNLGFASVLALGAALTGCAAQNVGPGGGGGGDDGSGGGGDGSGSATTPNPQLDATGKYNMQSTFDISTNMPGTVGTVVNDIIAATDDPNDPTQWVLQQIVNQLPSGTAKTLLNSVLPFVSGYLNDQVLNWAPDFVTTMVQVGNSFGDMAKHFGVNETLDISKASGAYIATHTATGVHFNINNVGSDYAFSAYQLPNVVAMNVGVTMNETGALTIATHQMPYSYGKILRIGLDAEIIPSIDSNASNLSQLLANHIDCATVGQDISDAIESNLGFSLGSSVFQTACTAGLTYGANFIYGEIDKIDASALDDLRRHRYRQGRRHQPRQQGRLAQDRQVDGHAELRIGPGAPRGCNLHRRAHVTPRDIAFDERVVSPYVEDGCRPRKFFLGRFFFGHSAPAPLRFAAAPRIAPPFVLPLPFLRSNARRRGDRARSLPAAVEIAGTLAHSLPAAVERTPAGRALARVDAIVHAARSPMPLDRSKRSRVGLLLAISLLVSSRYHRGMLRVGLLGVGDAGAHHARALVAAQAEELVTWSVVGARDIVKTAARCAELGMAAETRVVSPDELLAAKLCDAVIIASSDGLHREHAITALASGLHVLVEQPLALTLVDATNLVAMARDKDRVLQVGYHLRHHAGHELVQRDLATLVGNLRTIFIRWARPDFLTTDGSRAHADGARWSSLAALGTHGIDLALGLAAAPVTDAVCVRNPQRGIDRAAEVSLRFANGTVAHISVSIEHRARSIVLLTGTDGEIECLGTLGADGAGTIVHRTADSLRGPAAGERPLAFVAEDPYLRQLRAFAARCGDGRMKIDAHAITNVEVLHRITHP